MEEGAVGGEGWWFIGRAGATPAPVALREV